MPKGHRHLTYEQRCQIDVLLQRKIRKAEIGRQLGVHRSTITKEVQRNSVSGGEYECKKAHKKAIRKSKAATATPRKMTGKVLWLIEHILEKYQPDYPIGSAIFRNFSGIGGVRRAT